MIPFNQLDAPNHRTTQLAWRTEEHGAFQLNKIPRYQSNAGFLAGRHRGLPIMNVVWLAAGRSLLLTSRFSGVVD
jgi:hypothetical protein